jgi:ABC-type polysaccharide/polyol phosphate export permease
LLHFAVVCTVGTLAFSAIGLLVASRVRTIEGVSGLANLVLVPMWLGSGVFFAYERFPEQLHGLLRALPLTALNDALRAGMIDGVGLAESVPQLLVLAAWTVVSFVVALRIFRWS